MLPQEVIRKKRDGNKLNSNELEFFFESYLKEEVADYQMSAMLMAIFLKGFDSEETAQLTSIMKNSGTVFDWGRDNKTIIDKHSTGGVGDKTSLVILPLAILEGLHVPMISGRGLGHTGGTLDKLESIGMKVFMDEKQARKMMDQFGGVFLGQTKDMVPLDRKLYSMRDVTSTVESIPLIVASILSKKMAEGIGGLVMDVKFGSGAFMADLDSARELAAQIIKVSTQMGVEVSALITSMNSPLGDYAGNSLEVYECIQLMQGEGPESTRSLIIELTAHMVKLGYPDRGLNEIRTSLSSKLQDGSAYELFCKIAVAQGGDAQLLASPEKLVTSKIKKDVTASSSGVISKINTRNLGLAIVMLGGGRRLITDAIDHSVGLGGMLHVGAKVQKGDVLTTIYGNDESKVAEAMALLKSSFTIEQSASADPLIVEIVE